MGGLVSNVFYFHPDPWEKNPIGRAYFSDGWFNHQPVFVGLENGHRRSSILLAAWFFGVNQPESYGKWLGGPPEPCHFGGVCKQQTRM